MGKYDDVAKKYPRAQPAPGEFQERVAAVKAGGPVGDLASAEAFVDEVEGLSPEIPSFDLTPERLAKHYLEAVDAKKLHDAAGKALNVRLAALEQLMLQAFEAADVDSLTIAGRPVKFDNGLTTRTVDPEAFYRWVRQQGLQALLTMHSGRISSLTKERVLAGAPIPDGIEVRSWRRAWPRSGSEEE